MRDTIRIGIVGDRDPDFAPHSATQLSILHSAAAVPSVVISEWIATDAVAEDFGHRVLDCDGLWIAPGSPYRNRERVLQAIRYAREMRVPLLGTCGGFQHVVLEYARNVLGFTDAAHAEESPLDARLFIVPLSCSLVGREMPVILNPSARTAQLYGMTNIVEQYYCNFGLNPTYESALNDAGLMIVGRDADGEARIVEIRGHPYFVATLFVPALRSSRDTPHPLVTALLRAASRQKEVRARQAALVAESTVYVTSTSSAGISA